jgi:O-succinylbenzoic acid--CoA ligase
MDSPPLLTRLSDDPVSLPAALLETWGRGDAAVVLAASTDLPPDTARLLSEDRELPAGTALVVLTSGSSGAPRAVILSHSALSASTAASVAALDCRPGERWALALPLRHIAGLQVLARSRSLGTEAFVVPDPGDPAQLVAAADHAQHIALVPTQLVRCLEASVDLGRFRSVLVGGGPLDPSQAERARAAGVRLVQSYGMTETCGGCVYDGQPLPDVEVELDRTGRIRLRGPVLATGYLDPSPSDAARFTPDGWFKTDDLGSFREQPDGSVHLAVVGRSDDVINTGGIKIAPAAIEAILRRHPGVIDALVLGVPDREWGERICAVIVPRSDLEHPTLEALQRSVGSELPPTHLPRAVALAAHIHRDGLGKVLDAERQRLRSLAERALGSGAGGDSVS